MINVSEIYVEAPGEFKTQLHKITYDTLKELEIPFKRVETDEVITMEDCERINVVLEMEMVKTLFLCNRQKTDFYLFVTKGDKHFDSKGFSSSMGISRVSFAPIELMEKMLGTKIGAATVFSMLTDVGRRVNLVMDEDVVTGEHYGCSDGTTTGYMKLKTRDVLNKLIPHSKCKFKVIRTNTET